MCPSPLPDTFNSHSPPNQFLQQINTWNCSWEKKMNLVPLLATPPHTHTLVYGCTNHSRSAISLMPTHCWRGDKPLFPHLTTPSRFKSYSSRSRLQHKFYLPEHVHLHINMLHTESEKSGESKNIHKCPFTLFWPHNSRMSVTNVNTVLFLTP